MKLRNKALTALILCVGAGILTSVAGATSADQTINFNGLPLGNVSSIPVPGSTASIPIAAYGHTGAAQAYLATAGGTTALGVRTNEPCRRVHIGIGLACPEGAVGLQSFRLVGTTAPTKIVLFDRGGNYGPGVDGLMVPATGINGSQVITFGPGTTGLLDDAVAEIAVLWDNGDGFVDDLVYTCDDDTTEPPTPGLSLTKTATPETVKPGEAVTYTYTVSNTGGVAINGVTIVDDNGTPATTADDFVVDGTPVNLAVGETRTFTTTLVPIASQSGDTCMVIDGVETTVGHITVTPLPSGNVRVLYEQALSVIDNTYGTTVSSGYPKGHTFSNLLGSDKAGFRFRNANGDIVLEFLSDYISASSAFPSGYGCLGATGGDGKMVSGSAANIVSITTSIATNLNQSPAFYGFTTNSPAQPNANWDYVNSYTMEISAAAFGASGFGSAQVTTQHNSPSKLSFNEVIPEPCDAEATNVATATGTAVIDGVVTTLTATDSATVSIGTGTTTGGGKPPKPPKTPKPPKGDKGHDGDDDGDDKGGKGSKGGKDGKDGKKGRGRGRR